MAFLKASRVGIVRTPGGSWFQSTGVAPAPLPGVLVYLNNILIFSETMEEHVKLVRQVLEKLLAAKLYVKLSKCEFHKESLDYLGYRISNRGIEMDPGKVKAVLDWLPPKT
uniref:ribonuclease H n=1 Tax=Micrurus lemniscatus lemniscatus TaxID=129467 RepID=A0A2D4I0M5_MICLE